MRLSRGSPLSSKKPKLRLRMVTRGLGKKPHRGASVSKKERERTLETGPDRVKN
jgi:hypothetical protein